MIYTGHSNRLEDKLRPISLATFIASIFVLGLTLLWFPNMVAVLTPLMPVGTPYWLTDFLVFLPWIMFSIILIALVIKLAKRGKPKGFDNE